MFGNTNELNFALDETPGVSNTFDVPTYDYRTLLSHNIYYNLNARSKIVVDDGNTSRVGMNQTTQNAKWFKSNLFIFNLLYFSSYLISVLQINSIKFYLRNHLWLFVRISKKA